MQSELRGTSYEVRKKITSFADLNAWREARVLAKLVYSATKAFPKEEIFGITSQMRRAVVSVSSNIAEGFSRKTMGDREHFYTMALGSLTELQSQLLIACDVDYLSDDAYNRVNAQAIETHKVLNGLIRSTKELRK